MVGRKKIRLSSVAVFLAVILICLLLSRWEESRTTAAAPADNVPVLMYHHILKRSESGKYSNNNIVTFLEDFEKQMAWLHNEGYQTISPNQLEAWLLEDGALPQKSVMITFDDGYLSNFVYARPILQQYGFCATIFSVTEKIADTREDFTPTRIQMADGDSMQEGSDVFYYASHTHNLHTLSNNRSGLVNADNATVRKDLTESLAALEDYPSAALSVFSYPYGNYSDRVVDILKEKGIRIAFTARAGKLTKSSNPYALPRYPVSSAVSFSRFQSYFE